MTGVRIGVRVWYWDRPWWLRWRGFFERGSGPPTTCFAEFGRAGSVVLDFCAGEDTEDCYPFWTSMEICKYMITNGTTMNSRFVSSVILIQNFRRHKTTIDFCPVGIKRDLVTILVRG